MTDADRILLTDGLKIYFMAAAIITRNSFNILFRIKIVNL